MADFVEIDFLAVETAKSGDTIAVRYSVNGTTTVHVVDGGFLDTGDKLVEHIKAHYQTTHVDHVVLTHTDLDHVNGLRKVLEHCTVGCLWTNRPWLYAEELIDRFETSNSVDALRRRLRAVYAGPPHLLCIGPSGKSFTVMQLPAPCSQRHKLCSFLSFWGSHEGRSSHAADAGVRVDFRSAQRTPSPPRPGRIAGGGRVRGAVRGGRLHRHRGLGQGEARVVAPVHGARARHPLPRHLRAGGCSR